MPALGDLYSTRLQAVGYWSFLGGLAATSVAILTSSETGVRIGGSLLALSVAVFVINVGKMLVHFARPQIAPFGAK